MPHKRHTKDARKKDDVQRAHDDQRSLVIRRSVVRFSTRCLYWLPLCSGRCPRPAGREDGLGVRLLVADFLLLPGAHSANRMANFINFLLYF